ncbi:hypothetical protein GCM10022422_19320 [Flavobacterium ginsengisoli]|uniref:Glycosyltransferase 2-like domain-containing protein n=1 Tax=Flavobacterium ginsengisoli TaxID=871694 RepID=A0ABP7FCH4_9FLAO
MSPKLSVIIPCYNSEATLELTLNSILNQNFQEWEAIIINDGSKDATEEISIKWTEKDKRFKYFSKENGGLGKARNFGIERAQGIYILPLDSDNLVEENFSRKAISVFEKDLSIGVVHGYAEYFGEKKGLWKIEDFNLQKMLIHNYIDACAIFKKELWQKNGGYDENMPHQGHEDWEFWLALGINNTKFYNLNEITFKYFVAQNSMIRSFSKEMMIANQDYIAKKYCKVYYDEYCKTFFQIKNTNKKIDSKLKSEKFVINLFCYTFFRFKIFKENRS